MESLLMPYSKGAGKMYLQRILIINIKQSTGVHIKEMVCNKPIMLKPTHD